MGQKPDPMRKALLLLLLFTLPLAADRRTSAPRNFYAELTTQDKQDIRYIVLTLAANNPLTILPYVTALNKAGDRIGPVHPLPFLAYILTQEDLKVGIRNLRKQNGKLWKEFLEGLVASLEEESNRNNLTPEMLQRFSDQVGVDYKLIEPYARQHRWADMVNVLINKVPRQGDHGRYDM
ncbi:MAG: hypothetical protein AB7F31_01975 [Parachlamydiales bacterium]